MSDYAEQLKNRTKQYALRVIRLVNSLPPTAATRIIGDQLLRSGTSVASNYRAACRARSRAEFCSKLGVVEEEADESVFWMELTVESGMLKAAKVTDLLKEGQEITAVIVSSINTARRNLKKPTKD